MADELLSGVYAMALFRVAKRAEKVREWGEELSALGGLLGRSERLRIFLAAPNIDKDSKKGVIERIADLGKFSPEFKNFFTLLVKRRKVALVHLIVKDYNGLANDYFGRLDVEVRSAVPLQGDEKEELNRVFADSYKKEARINYQVAPALIAGILVRAGGKIYDSSLLGQLRKMKSRMLEG